VGVNLGEDGEDDDCCGVDLGEGGGLGSQEAGETLEWGDGKRWGRNSPIRSGIILQIMIVLSKQSHINFTKSPMNDLKSYSLDELSKPLLPQHSPPQFLYKRMLDVFRPFLEA
jgi:hypothetical protein